MIRPSKNKYYLNIAKAVAARSTCIRRQYGAVIVSHGEIIATGYNGSVRGGINCCDINDCPRMTMPHNTGDYSLCRGVHAEQNAIISASRQEMIGAELYIFGIEDGKDIKDTKPCPVCDKLIKNAGIKYIITTGGVYENKNN